MGIPNLIGLRRGLRRRGVLGLNQRNADYILQYNPRRLYPLVDDKLTTKQLCIDHGIAVPELYGVIETEHDVRHFQSNLEGHSQFVVKPANGSGGDGIVVITGRYKERFRRGSGLLLTASDLEHHISNTLSGLYSLGGHPDRCFLEYCVQFHPMFDRICHGGVPDIRTIIFRGYPVMAMVRLPTRMSDGKANLHQGAIGVGVDMASGRTVSGVQVNERVAEHPDTQHTILGLKLPEWESLLGLAARCYEVTGLGFLGVDVVLDRDLGPLVLELNARPGLSIQIANNDGLLRRLQMVEQHGEFGAPVGDRVAFSRERLGAETVPEPPEDV
jgi:alpha-L-glutamate ligase-like protein